MGQELLKMGDPACCCGGSGPADSSGTVRTCPACGTEGRPVKPVTPRSLLQPHLRPEVREEAYRFCASPDCAVVYFSGDGRQTFSRADLTVRVGLKERSAPRPLCYCFGHSAESLREEWTRTGKSGAAGAIKAELKAGGCRCEVTNPSGGCCLGDVLKEVEALTSAAPAPAPGPDGRAPAGPSHR